MGSHHNPHHPRRGRPSGADPYTTLSETGVGTGWQVPGVYLLLRRAVRGRQ
ncbi:MAG: hypothetical protein ACK53Y_13715 [bacterium]